MGRDDPSIYETLVCRRRERQYTYLYYLHWYMYSFVSAEAPWVGIRGEASRLVAADWQVVSLQARMDEVRVHSSKRALYPAEAPWEDWKGGHGLLLSYLVQARV